MTAYLPHAPGYIWLPTSCLTFPLPSYTFINGDCIRVGVRKGLVVLWLRYILEWILDGLHALALLLAGVALVDGWRRGEPRGVVVGRLEDLKPRQLELPLAS